MTKLIGVGKQGVQLRPEVVAVAERHADQVARHGNQRHGLPDRIDRSHHHRVRQRRRSGRDLIDAKQQDVEPLVRAGAGRSARGEPVARETAPSREDPGERALNAAPYRYAAACGTTTSRRRIAIPIIPRRPVGPGRRVSRNACPTASSRKRRRIKFSVSSAARTSGAAALAASWIVGWLANRNAPRRTSVRLGTRKTAASCRRPFNS